jgi:hypothetical protein
MSSIEESDSSESWLAGLLTQPDVIGDQDGGVACDTWSPVTVDSFETEIAVDNVDDYLLKKARAEAEIVSNRLMSRMFGRRNRRRNSVVPIDTLKLFMQPALLGHLKSFINRSTLDQISSAELIQFIKVELLLSFYTCTPGKFFDVANERHYPSGTAGITKQRYHEILQAMGSQPTQSDNASSTGWSEPLKHDRDLAGAMQLARTICAAISYVQKVSVLSMDDDLLRLRSRLVESFGFAQINNPNKGLGTVHHGIVSICTGLFCCGHVGSRGESVLECVQILLLALSGSSILSQAKIECILAFDRGYGGTEGEVMAAVTKLGADLAGTAKKIPSFPFTFGKPPVRNQVLIPEDGAKSVFWMQKVTPALAATNKKHYALAYRSGLGRVVLAQTTLEIAGPGKWAFVSQSLGDKVPIATLNAALSEFERDNIVQLTACQRTPEWFLLRFGRITGTTAWAVLNNVARRMRQTDYVASADDMNFVSIFQCLSLKYVPIGVASNEQECPAERIYTEDELKLCTNAALKEICRAKGLRLGGNKNELVGRILSDGLGADAALSATVQNVLMKCWFMSPTKSESMKLGSINEDNILKAFPRFIDKHCHSIHIEQTKEYGLLHLKGSPEAAFSPDCIASVLSTTRGRFIAVCEFKTLTKTHTTEAADRILLQRFGFQSVDVVQDAATFKLTIPKGSYRGQVLHDMCCAGVDDIFYISASLSSIIRVVHLRCNQEFRLQYVSQLAVLREQHMRWIYNNEGLPPFTNDELGYCKDSDTLATTLALWKATNRLVSQRQRPLPPGRHILPFIIALWNKIKGGIDVFSRMLKNCKSCHHSLNPGAALWSRLLMTLVYNGYQSWTLLKVLQY